MINLLNYASLAAHIYTPEKKAIGSVTVNILNSFQLNPEWMPDPSIDWYRLPDVNPNMQPYQAFYAQLYVKFEHGRAIDAVIAIRGTVPSKTSNDIVDIISYSSDVLGDGSADMVPNYLPQAISFFCDCEAYLREYFPGLQLNKVTGHSLGGAVAQLMPLQAGYPAMAICFNSPGCGHIPGVEKDRGAWVVNVNAAHDFVSKVGLTLGKLYVVNVTESDTAAATLFKSFDEKRFVLSDAEIEASERTDIPLVKTSISLVGHANRFYTYLESLDKLNHTSELQKAYLHCETPLRREPWLALQSNLLLQAAGCDVHALAKEYDDVITDQHDINHLIKGLSSSPNLPVAFSVVG